ncbi:DUF3109 family protein [bacterium]|nr:DUF3109 family protein [bacterium]
MAKIANLSTAKYKCHFPACGGVCCKNGRPGLTLGEIDLIRDNLGKFVSLMRLPAQVRLKKNGFITKRVKEGRRTMAVVEGWCIFANEGCVLQKVGTSEGEKWKYKPHRCVLFPITTDIDETEWYVRQKGYKEESWDLFCLNRSQNEKIPATESLKEEINFFEKFCKG